jgi:protein-L-isoaspartate(D-aspartate) O-methyltransferase
VRTWLLTLAIVLAACVAAPITPTIPAQPIRSPSPSVSDLFAQRRKEMVVSQIQSRDVTAPDVLDAMNTVPRHSFVPQEYLDQAYEDHPLPIGYGQTISQPYIVALMTEKLKVKRGDKVLEIGTGSGYQAAVLAHIGMEVYSVEIIPELARAADERLKQLGYAVSVKQGDGYLGWEEHAPYDAIIVTAAPDHVPQPLVKQLKDGGRLVIPIGPQGSWQTLWQFTRKGDDLQAVDLGGVAFVPLVRK